MSILQRQIEQSNQPKKPKPAMAKQWVTKPLSNTQKAELAIAARAAYDIQIEHGLTDAKFDAWRHQQTEIACGKSSLREATNRDYRSIKAHFFRLAGRESAAKEIWAKTGRVKGSEELHDTHENRELARALIRDKITASNGRINDAYVEAILADKHPGQTLLDLTASQLQNLLYTIINRLSKK